MVDAELAMYGEAEQAAAEAEHLAEQQAASEAGTDIRDDARNVEEPIGETPAETAEPQSGIGAEPVASLDDSAVAARRNRPSNSRRTSRPSRQSPTRRFKRPLPVSIGGRNRFGGRQGRRVGRGRRSQPDSGANCERRICARP